MSNPGCVRLIKGGGLVLGALLAFLFLPDPSFAQALPSPQANQVDQLARQVTDDIARLLDETVAKLDKIQDSPAATPGKIAQLLALAGKVARDIKQTEDLVAKGVSTIAAQAGVSEADVRAALRARIKALGAGLGPTMEARLADAIGRLEAARDRASNPGVAAVLEAAIRVLRSIAVRFDSTPPAIRIVEPADGASTNINTPVIRVTYSDALSGVRIATLSVLRDGAVELAGGAVVGAGEATIAVAATQAFPDGRRVLTARIEDAAGNAGTATASLVVDTRPPAITIASPANGGTIATLTPEIVVQYSDAAAGIETSGVNTATLSIVINDVDRTALFSVTGAEARFQPTGLETPSVLQEGGNRIVVSLSDRVSNAGTAEAAFTIQCQSSKRDWTRFPETDKPACPDAHLANRLSGRLLMQPRDNPSRGQ
jgi:hypothetical protein